MFAKEAATIAYVTVTKDLSQVKTKFLFNLTKRQVIFFGLGVLVGLPVFFLLRNSVPASAAALIMILIMMPFFLFAMYEKNGEPMEKIARHFIDSKFRRPRRRIYKTNNIYTVLLRQAKLDREVSAIVRGR